MADESIPEIVVTGRPETGAPMSFAPFEPVSSGPGGGGANRILQENLSAAPKVVVIDEDAKDEEILVVGNRMKSINLYLMMIAGTRITQSVNLPCVGVKSIAQIRAMLANLRFRVTSTVYGEKRGGENNSTESTTVIPIEINKDVLKAYGMREGDSGLVYLLLHEISHTFPEMREFNRTQFKAFRAGAGKDMTYSQAKEAFERSPEFALNEARTNTIAEAIAKELNKPYTYVPPFGKATC